MNHMTVVKITCILCPLCTGAKDFCYLFFFNSYTEMSRPHDGHRPSFPFGNAFRMIRPKGSYVSPKLLMLSNSFEERLAESLKRLKPKDNSSVLSLSWMISAMESLCETHIDIKNLITELQFPVSSWEEKWIDLYLDNSVKLLDICIAFSSELSRLSQSKLLLRYALHVLDFSNKIPSSKQLEEAQSILHHDWMQQIWLRSPKLENCTTILQELVGSLFLSNVKSAKGKLLMQAVYGVMVKTIFVCSIFTAAYMGSVKPLVDLEVPDKFLWSEAFKDLQVNVNGQIRRSSKSNGVVLKELEAAQSHVEKLCAMIDSNDHKEAEILKESVSGLGQSCEGLSDGLVLLSKKVDEFFQVVLRGRDALLGKLRASDLNPNEQC